ncbi:peptidoglycan-binding domain-containing protein [Breoghania sp.]|uniref:peptidoglycan-binding domain-containing protein n=1 Tax=Breoghania sp. TaxID=2065378 RepID=UPI002604747A|nr:peptidoglycan-binding domain-containing protein [Breoghania sp.]MDJ0930651.1 peptidoglycan-binding domain-containing protein [Breoghania sp.]
MTINAVLRTGMVGVLVGGMVLAPLSAPKLVARYVSGEAQADSIGNFFKKMNKPKKKGRSKNSDFGIKVLQGIGAGVVVMGLAKGNAGAIIIDTALVAAPIVFRKEIEPQYGRDQRWAGCLNCNKKRVLVQPGRTVTQADQKAILTRIEEDVRDIQGALKVLGFYRMRIDGDYGPGSRRAAAEFQESQGYRPTGILSAYQRAELFRLASERG